MQNTPSPYAANSKITALAQSFFMQVYSWMAAGLLATGVLAYYTAHSPFLLSLIFGNKLVFFGLIVANLGIVFGLSRSIQSLSATAASFLFFLYSALNGLTLASIFLVYTNESIATVFFITAGTFGATAAYGYTTKADLSKWGSILFMALIGLIIASVVNMFLQSPAMMWVLTYAGVLIFVGLTAYDTQRLKQMAYSLDDEETVGKFAVLGALTLYLDFINLFLYLLRIFGKRR
ncbi:Bax inhibitor-1/YccA family protein [Sporomusa termitida]|uniref:Inner membrane protein YbhL n=1 Tax=Sporomusa termitida TaxID=2377 RepID=A0A517DQG4_9FIRM|nr:Bax inhibitor-1/YccA family protein [Sporomusa termitida]QDR79558.1 Inner membrane protein YbhL [Sporomusa termitida]